MQKHIYIYYIRRWGGASYKIGGNWDYTRIYATGGFYKFTFTFSDGKPDKVIYAGSTVPVEYQQRCIIVDLETGRELHDKICWFKTID